MVRSHRHVLVVAILATTTALAAVNASAAGGCATDPLAFFGLSARTTTGDLFDNDVINTDRVDKTPTDGGIKEEIPDKYRERFDKWKTELLSTDFGRAQWEKYANNKNFILKIVVSKNRSKGAGTGDYVWNDDGQLIGATITLSASLEDGSPNPIYYPVLNSLSTETMPYWVSGQIVAATKLSHELGHVNQASDGSMKQIQLQNKLIVQYNSIFMENGLNAQDKKLLDLVAEMKGTPVEIWESREYWSEVNAMLYLNQRISKEDFYCPVFKRIRRNIETYAKAYEDRFSQHSEFNNSPCWR